MGDGVVGGDPSPERLIGERIAGRFAIERYMGSGELSSSYRALDERLHRRVTVKLFHPRHQDDVGVVRSQLAAARSVARLSHEHVAMVIDQGEHEGQPLVVLEHVRGENLAERIERFAPLAVGEVVAYALQIARALAYAHGHGVVHGNLRPGNVLLTEEREVKLVDFGGGSYVARLVGDPFAAPELREVEPDAPPEPGDDVFALGALIFVALVEGHPPVPDIDPGELQLLRPDVSPRLAAIVARALSGDPEQRQESMREMAAELSGVREAGAGTSMTVGMAATDPGETRAFSPGELATAQDAGAGAPERPPARPRRAPRRERSPRETRARLLAWSMVVAPLVAVVLFGIMIAGERGKEQVDRKPSEGGGPTELVSVASATSFDPKPGGDGEEHEVEAANAIDDDPDSSWTTEGYDLDNFNGTKPGAGLILDLGAPRDVRDVAILTDLPNWRVEVRSATTPATTLAGWKQRSKVVSVRGGQRIAVDMHGHPARYILLWVTKLALDPDDANKSRARIDGVRVFATKGDGSGAPGSTVATVG